MRPVLPLSAFRQSLARPAFRQQQRQFPRFASNSSLENSQKQAQETLGKVWESTKKFLEPAGTRIGQMLGSYKQPLLYDLAVARELVKHIYRAENLQPPSVSAIRSAYSTIWSRATSGLYWRETVRSREIVRIGIYGVEAYTIFKVGEILGRRHLIDHFAALLQVRRLEQIYASKKARTWGWFKQYLAIERQSEEPQAPAEISKLPSDSGLRLFPGLGSPQGAVLKTSQCDPMDPVRTTLRE